MKQSSASLRAVLFAAAALAPAAAGQSVDRATAVHVLNRMTFGATPALVDAVVGDGDQVDAFIASQLDPDSVPENPEVAALLAQLSLPQNLGDPSSLQEIQGARLVYAFDSYRQLNEVMVHFWEIHFNTAFDQLASYVGGNVAAQCWLEWRDNQMFRGQALGTFRSLLHDVTLSPAMMIYLNQVHNRCLPRPNENYAREFLELYAMGPVDEGSQTPNYDQDDVIVVARAFTGWTLDGQLQPVFDSSVHCSEAKVLFEGYPHQHLIHPGGASELGDVTSYIAGIEPTADFICRKLVRYFVADEAGDPGVEDALVQAMKDAWGPEGDIRAVMQVLLASSAFRGTTYRWRRARTPWEKVCWWPRAFGASVLRDGQPRVAKLRVLLERSIAMGQSPYRWPAPDGFPLGSQQQLGSGVAIETTFHYGDVSRQIGNTAPYYSAYPNLDLGALVRDQLPQTQWESPAAVATLFLEWLYPSDWLTTDRAAVAGAMPNLDSASPLLYQRQLAVGAAAAGCLLQGSLR